MPGRLHLGGLLALAASLAIAGCGDDPVEPAALAPPDAPLYAEVVVRPTGERAAALDAFAERVAGVDDLGAEVVAGLEGLLAGDGLEIDYAEQIEPWLGERAAFFVRSFEPGVADGVPDFALIVETEDADAARSFVEDAAAAGPEPEEERSYEGHDYLFSRDDETAAGLVDGLLVVATETSFRVAVDASEGESLAESEDYLQRTEPLPDDRLATAFVEPGAAVDAAIASEELDDRTSRLLGPLIGGPLSDPIAAGLAATTESATLELVSMLDDDERVATDASLVEALPSGSWFAVGVPELGAVLGRVLDQLANAGLPGGGSIEDSIRDATGIELRAEALAWLGDAAGFVEGTGVPGFTAGLIAETTDPARAQPLLDRLRRIAERDSGLRSAGPPQDAQIGFSLGLPGLGGGAEAGVVGDRLVAVIGGSVAQALEPESTLGDDPAYEAAVEPLGADFPAGLFVALPSFFEVAERGGSADDPDYRAAEPYLDAFEALAAGTSVDDGLARTRIAVSLAG